MPKACSIFCSAVPRTSRRRGHVRSLCRATRTLAGWRRRRWLAERTTGAASTGHVVAYCVRLCDGQHFPLEHMTNATQVETCRAMCPASKTKMYFGSDIGASVAKDGARYADLDTASSIANSWSPIAPATAKTVSVWRRSICRPIRPAAGRYRFDQDRSDGLYRQTRSVDRFTPVQRVERRHRVELGHVSRASEPAERA